MQMLDAYQKKTPGGGARMLCSLRIGGALYGIDVAQIQEVLGEREPVRVPLAPWFIAGVISYRGDVLTMVCGRTLLGVPMEQRRGYVLVVEDASGHRFGLLVDEVSDAVVVEDGNFEANLSTLDDRRKALFAGAYKMPGESMVVLEAERLLPTRLAQWDSEKKDGGTRCAL